MTDHENITRAVSAHSVGREIEMLRAGFFLGAGAAGEALRDVPPAGFLVAVLTAIVKALA